MILRKLIIHNIASIEHAEIDFLGDILKNESLFLITGETGSGKTTILDAISLCLYKVTPRINGRSDEKVSGFTTYKDEQGNASYISVADPRLLLRRNTVEAYTSLEFEDNYNNIHIAKWGVKKSHGKVDGNLQKATWELTNKATNITLVKEAEVQKEILNCVGMTFTEFCRTCMLSQGEFTRFLKSSEKEKGEILEKLTQTEIYSQIGKNIFAISKQKRQELEKKKIELESVKLLSEEEEKLIRTKIAQDKEEDEKKRLAINILNQKIEYLKRWFSLLTDKAAKEKQLQQSNDYLNSEECKKECNIINLWSDTIHLRSQISERNRCKGDLIKQSQKVNNYKSKFLLLNSGLKYHIESNEKMRHNNEDIDKSIDIIQQKIDNTQQEYSNFNLLSLTQEQTVFIKEKENLVALKSTIALYQQNKLPIDNIVKKIENDNKDIKNIDKQLQDIEIQINTLVGEYQKAKMQYEKIASSLDLWAKKTRLKLSEGDICPLCGQRIDKVFKDEDFRKIASPLEEEIKRIDKQLHDTENEKNKKVNKIDQLQKEIQSLNKEKTLYQKKIDDLGLKIRELCNSLSLPLMLEENSLELDHAVENTQRKITNISSQIEKANKLVTELTKLQSQRTDLLLIKEQMKNEYNLINSCIDIKKDLDEFTVKWEQESIVTQQVKDLLNEWKKMRDDFFAWKKQIDSLRSNISFCESNINAFLKENSSIQIQDIEQLNSYTELSVKELKVKHESNIKQRNQLQGALDHINNELEICKQEEIEVKENENIEDLQKIKEQQEKDYKDIQLRIGANLNILKENEKNVIIFSEKMKEREVLQKDCDKWEWLNNELGTSDGNKFRKIAQKFILNDLLDKSNYYLHRFSERFELCSQKDTLSILIKDLFEGGLISPATNLSGGEGFMVSLSLALGLSKMSTNNSFCDILFIDEGFGTLSGEYLNLVIETLEKLHQIGGKRVGVISHVSDLKERISTQIRVKRKDNTTSSVEIIRT